MFPSDSVILGAFNAQNPLNRPKEPKPAGAPGSIRREPFPAWSVIDESKKKADAFTKEAAREFDVASQKAQSKTGKIEPWTPKYYAACTVGGLLACVRLESSYRLFRSTFNGFIGSHPYSSDATGFGQMPPTS
jgi:solute carrier family 25 phosphate transporter 3